jgi:hypothetical protein
MSISIEQDRVCALILAEPEGIIRLFVNEGEPLAALLRRMKVEGKSGTPPRSREMKA